MKKSFTFIELAITIIVLGILALVAIHPLVGFYNLWSFSNYKMEILWGATTLIQDMAKNMRMTKDKTSIYTATATHFEFDIENPSGGTTRIRYQLAGDKLYKNGNVFMDSIDSLSFAYYDSSDNLIASPLVSPNKTDIRSVEIDLTLTSGTETVSLKSKIQCRNLS
ncbi:MAG: hypothetical protein JSW17_06820 [Candidatus Omnitrophota bacterium]|nr:MAG: hypothetical protein JSW17_06820 [Candidatus Omnitrophota bacterium]